MQISNQSVLSAAFSGVGSALNRKQLPEQFAARPVTIEGQIVENDEDRKRARKQQRENLSAEQGLSRQGSENQPNSQEIQQAEAEQSLVSLSSANQSEQLGVSLLLDKKLAEQPSISVLNTEQIDNANEHHFPYSNRRSDNGLAGGALIIQKYLNNEPASHQSNIFIDKFI